MGVEKIDVRLPDIIGKGYKSFWNWRGRYLVCKGSRGSKKSTTAALKMIYNIMKYPKTNGLVIRRYDVTHRGSTYAQLKWAINRLGVSKLWKANLSPMQLTYIKTGQQIFFRGMDDPQSIASITVSDGYLNFVWIEEFFQITNEADFDKLDLSIRGELPDELYKQFIMTFNPWSECWIKNRFFDNPDEDTLSMTTDYRRNEFLGKDDIKIFEKMKEKYPRRYEVEGLGNWGRAEGLIYNNWEIKDFDWRYKFLNEYDKSGNQAYTALFGMDFGFTTDPTAFIALLASAERKEIWVFDEIYKYGWKNADIVKDLKHKEYHKVKIMADSAEPRTIDALTDLGLSRIKAAKKGIDSVRAGINKLQDYKIYVHPNCVNTEIELKNYVWAKDKFNKTLGRPSEDGYDHILDALRYACEELGAETYSFK